MSAPGLSSDAMPAIKKCIYILRRVEEGESHIFLVDIAGPSKNI